MTAKRLLPVLIAIAFLPLAASPAFAQPSRPSRARKYTRGFELNPYFTFTDFDRKSAIDDEFGIGFRYGYLYTPHHEIEFMLNAVATDDVFDPSEDVDATNFQVAYVYNFTKKDVVPYVTVGIGFLSTDDAFLGDEIDPVLGLGAGVRFFMGRNVYARFEWRVNSFEGDLPVFADNESFTFREVAFGIGWRYGLP
jgi:opacity protein-like surface antigen